MNKAKWTIVSAVIILILCLSAIVGVLAAWFVSEGKKLIVTEGNVKISVDAYLGYDTDYDGVTEAIPTEEQEGKTLYSRDNTYYALQKDIITEHGTSETNAFAADPGNRLTYKLVVSNTSSLPADISVCFSELSAYFFSFVDSFVANQGDLSADDNLTKTISEHTARIMFCISGVKATVLGETEADNTSLDTTLDSSFYPFMPSEITAETPADYRIPLWLLSRKESFAQGLALDAGQTMEIDFCIEALEQRVVVNYYQIYGNANYPALVPLPDNAAADFAENYVNQMLYREMLYMLSAEDSTGTSIIDFAFTIDKMIVTGQSRGEVSA